MRSLVLAVLCFSASAVHAANSGAFVHPLGLAAVLQIGGHFAVVQLLGLLAAC